MKCRYTHLMFLTGIFILSHSCSQKKEQLNKPKDVKIEKGQGIFVAIKKKNNQSEVIFTNNSHHNYAISLGSKQYKLFLKTVVSIQLKENTSYTIYQNNNNKLDIAYKGIIDLQEKEFTILESD